MRTLYILVVTLLSAPTLAAGLPFVVVPFKLPGTDGTQVQLSNDVDARFHVLCFLGTECPLAKLYGPRLQTLADQYDKQGVRFIGINSNIQDSMDEWKEFGHRYALTFPLAKDFDRAVAISAGATRTPEVVVIDNAGKVRYRGRIDDQYQPGIARKTPTVNDLQEALEQLLAGNDVKTAVTQAVGCLIAMPRKKTDSANAAVTYCKDIVPVLQRNCIECHREGEIGPFPLDDYAEIAGWADMMMEVVDEGRMPPWHASGDHAKFANARHMTDEDKQALRDWVDGGLPYGDQSDMPEKLTYTTGWRLEREPDAEFAISKQPFRVPADGTVEYQYYVVDPKFTEDKWVTAAEIVPGDRSVVHHCIAFVRPPDGASMQSIGMLAGFVPGQMTSPLPKGYARRVVAGSRIVFQMHYTPTGQETDDLTRIGLLFADEKDITHEVFAMGGVEQEFEIPPGDANHVVTGTLRGVPKDGRLLSIMPHMHLRGKSFELAKQTSGSLETVLSVPQYDFNWQHNYELAEPLDLSDVRSLQFKATFDNSAQNPTNPDASEYVTWGDQTWQEMAVVFVAVAKPRDLGTPSEQPAEQFSEKAMAADSAAKKRATKFADEYISRFDKNGDRHVSKRELPTAVGMFSFGSMDHNRDLLISHDEIMAEAYWRFTQ